MGPDKPSSFYNYYVVVLLFGGRMRPRDNTSFWQQGPDFDIVRTCEWLSYVRACRSQAYGVLVRFFLCRVYIDSSRHDTLDYEWQLVVAVIS
jgi:ribulose bisphosphate carboxylase small subunit